MSVNFWGSNLCVKFWSYSTEWGLDRTERGAVKELFSFFLFYQNSIFFWNLYREKKLFWLSFADGIRVNILHFWLICMTTFGYGTCVLWICSYEMNPFRKMKNSWFLICFTNCLNKKPFTKTKTQKNVWLTLFNQLSQFWNGFLIYFPCFTQFSQFWKPVTYSHIFWIYINF